MLPNRSWLWRVVRGLVLVAAGFLASVSYLLGHPWIWWIRDRVPRGVRRRLTLIYLDGILVGYGLAWVGAIVVIGVVLWLRMRSVADTAVRRRRHARLLAVSVSVVLGLVILDGGAAVWSVWRRRTPRFLPVGVGGDAAGRMPAPAGRSPAGVGPEPSSRSGPGRTGVGTGVAGEPLHILVIGESSGRGEPYHPWVSVGQIVGWKLESVFPGRRIQVEIWATGGATLAEMHDRLAGLIQPPDALIVYVGHNEFQARYPWMREPDWYYFDDLPALYSPERLTSVLRHSPLCGLVLETWEHHRVSLRPPRTVTRELVDRPLCTREETGRILADFDHRLESIAGDCEQVPMVPIFIIPPSNDGGYDPSRSALAPTTTAAQRVAFARTAARARSLEVKDPAEAVRLDRELVARHVEFAEVHYRLARLLEQTGAWEEARQHYVEAREHDVMPLRCPEAFRRVFRRVADRHPSVLLVDGPRVLEAESAHGILDDRLFHDGQHPNLRGYAALAQEILHQLARRRAFGWPAGVEAPRVDAGACARHFGLDASRWAEVCRREAAFFRVTAYIRYDPKFRIERAMTYRRAAEAIERGTAPAEAGIPGWGMRPIPPSSSRVIPPGSPGPASW